MDDNNCDIVPIGTVDVNQKDAYDPSLKTVKYIFSCLFFFCY